MELEGASVLVTGGASGIGAASARRLAVLGARPVIADLSEEKGKALADELRSLGLPNEAPLLSAWTEHMSGSFDPSVKL